MSKVIHQPVLKSKAKNRLIVFLPFTVVTLLTTLSALNLLSATTFANPQAISASVQVLEACSISTEDDGNATLDNPFEIVGGTYNDNVQEATIKVLCNDRNGYSIYAVGYSNDAEGNNNLIGSTTDKLIPTGTVSDATVSNWAFKFSLPTGANANTTFTPTILGDTDGSFSSFHVIPSTTTKIATFTSSIDTSTFSSLTATYAVGISPYQDPDTYTGQVKYTVVHPNYANLNGKNIITIATTNNATGFTIDGTAYTNGDTLELVPDGTTHTIVASTSDFNEGYEFDSWSATGGVVLTSTSNSTTTFTLAGNGTLTLNGKQSCQTTVSGTMQDFKPCSDVANGTSGTLTDVRDSNTYTVAKIGSLWWMTSNLKTMGTVTAALSNFSGSDFNIEGGGTLATGDSTANTYTAARATLSTNSSYPGAYYNYCAASAGTVCTDSNSTEASSDICPSGWRLPTNAEFGTIGTSSGSTTNVSAFGAIYSGHYNSGTLSLTGSYGYWWSSTANGTTNRYYLRYYRGSLLSGRYYNDRQYGVSIRCVKS